MAWKRILAHRRAYQDWSPSADVAIALARQHNARLTGLYTIRELAMLKLVFGNDHPAARQAAARDEPLTAAAQEKFLAACREAGIDAVWDVGEGNATELLSLAGRCHDLLVVDQSPSGIDSLGGDLVEESAIACGTPTLIVPKTGSFPVVGRHVVVAWNHSRQAAAAMQAALPMMTKAERVTVLLGSERDVLSSITKRPRHDVADYLRAHVADVTAMPFVADNSAAGSELLDAVARVGGDVLVMGAYGRSSWREFLFGGATRDVLSNLNIPVLMAH